MFQIALNCKKCPSTVQATVCPSGQEAAIKLVKTQAVTESNTHNSNNALPASFSGAVASKKPSSSFFAQDGDDRSTLYSHNVHPIAKIALLLLLTMHSLSETPGLGSNGPSLSQFVISGHELAGQKSGLKLS